MIEQIIKEARETCQTNSTKFVDVEEIIWDSLSYYQHNYGRGIDYSNINEVKQFTEAKCKYIKRKIEEYLRQ